jgi:hypothetical protein
MTYRNRDLVKKIGKKASFNGPQFERVQSVTERLKSRSGEGLQVGTMISQSAVAVTHLIEYFPDVDSVEGLVSHIEHMIFISQIEQVVDDQQFTSRQVG